MCGAASVDVGSAFTSALDAQRSAAVAARPRGALLRASDNAWLLMNRGAAAAAAASAADTPDYPDVRVSSHVVAFGPMHVRGARRAPHGAAAGAAPPAPNGGEVAGPVLPPLEISSGVGGALDSLPRCPVLVPLALTLSLRNCGRGKALVSARALQSSIGTAALVRVEPPTLELARGAAASITLHITLLRPWVELGALIAIEISGGSRLVVCARAASAGAVFGVPLEDLATVPASAPGAAGHDGIPVPLALLRERLLAALIPNAPVGLAEEGVFRVSPSNEEREILRAQLDSGAFRGPAASCTGVAAAYMVKLFFREMPPPLLSAVPTETLLGAGTDDATFAAVRLLAPRQRALLAWLVDLLVVTAARSSANKMNERNLSICVGPNLFATDERANPMEALMASQKAVALLQKVLETRRSGAVDIFADVPEVAPARAKISGSVDIFADVPEVAPARAKISGSASPRITMAAPPP